MNSTQTEITLRLSPCSCGCQGQDPWHQRHYLRVIQDERPATGEVFTKAFGTMPIKAEGWAQFPWGRTRVVEVVSRVDGFSFWAIDHEDMLDVMNS